MTKNIFNDTAARIINLLAQGQPLHGREITRLLNTHLKTVQDNLGTLQRAGLLTCKTAGKNQQFTLSKHPAVHQALVMAEAHRAATFLTREFEIASIVNDLAQQTDAPMLIFGSHAKGYATSESDVDILILTEKKLQTKQLEEQYARKTHIIAMSTQRFERLLKQQESFPREVLANHIICQGFDYFLKVKP